MTGVEKTTQKIIRAAREGVDENDLDYAQLVRAVTNALVSINETHRVRNLEHPCLQH
jgi:hypothetical protein